MTSTTAIERELQSLEAVISRIAGRDDLRRTLAELAPGGDATLDGVFGSAAAALIAAIRQLRPRQTLLALCPDDDSAESLQQDLEQLNLGRVRIFPGSEPGDRAGPIVDPSIGERIAVLKRLAGGVHRDLIVAPSRAALQPVPSHHQVAAATRDVKVGDRLDIDEFCRWLSSHGLQSTTAVELPGEFSLRGGIVDVFASDWEEPVRIEWFDDTIESMRRISIEDQRSGEQRSSVSLTLLSSDQEFHEALGDLLPADAIVVLIEPETLDDQLRQHLKLADDPQGLLSRDAFYGSLAARARVAVSRLHSGAIGSTMTLATEPIEPFSSDLGEMRVEIDRLGNGHELYLACPTIGDRERVQEILSSTRTASEGRLHLVDGAVHQGFRLVRERLVVLSSDQLLNRHDLRRPSRRRLGKAIDSFLDLRVGDLVVHLSHGIGRFRGLTLLDKEGNREEHLELEFHGGTRIFVPAAKIDLVQKYIGGLKSSPKLARIGGKGWIRQKQAAESAVTDLAAEMLELQASRSSRPGVALGPDTEWQHEFETSFPFRETPDQLESLKAIKADQEVPRAMDRLLCGDVGFGKTEVAMRAAFKAVENGFQVAVLAPTTVLVEQHFRTFSERMAGFPFDIAKLSRFATPREQRDTIARLKSGKVDIVIGTHRLASRDVDFYNLGLLIIDEEQRFGVDIKEHLKSLRTMVDVLTTSATPIPRTLHMSLVGVRDISNLETPPEERLAVSTRITRFDSEVIRHAVLRELNRGGQIYFIHNRVQDIHLVRDRIAHIVPEASIAVGHGQMPEGELESVMTRFIEHQCDLLLATTIVENGLDIPNANTIFINEADRYGLSDLHQLRGRVGRYKHRAYAYLLIEPHKHVSPTAAKRLRAIEEFSDMGAGFAIAMRDLEIRGAGNLLGTEQSGHIAAVGYELYCQLLEKAVRKLRRLPPRMTLDVDIDLPVPAYLPDAYVVDKRHKIDLYRRLTRIERFEQVADFEAELLDRFGPLPTQARQLIQITELKLHAAVWQIESIHLDDHDMVIKHGDSARFAQLTKLHGRKLRIADPHTAHIRLKPEAMEGNRLLSIARSILQAGS